MLSKTIYLQNKLGLHARASAKLAQCCTGFRSKITISFNNKQVDAKSIMSVMLLAAANGSLLTFEIQGEDEHAAWDAISHLINQQFDESQ